MRTSHGFVCTILALTALGASSGAALARPFHRLTHVPGIVDYWPRFSPDGRTALFSRCEIPTGCGGASTSGYWTLWKKRIGRGKAAPFLVLPDTSATRSSWLLTAPSAREQIAFEGVDHRGNGPSALWVLGADGSGLRQVPLPPVVGIPSYPSWFPDGASVLLTGRGAQPATEDLGLHQLDALQGRAPDWSPNDRFVMFESSRACVDGNYAIFIEAASGGEAVQATDCRVNANHGVWSPDGKRFLFSYAFGDPTTGRCAGGGCRGLAIAPVPARIHKLGTAR